MTLDEKIVAACRNWARTVSQDLKTSLEKALSDGQPLRNPTQEASLNFYDEVSLSGGVASVKILATDEYWINIEEGRGAGKKRPPSDKLGKQWQNKNNIDPRVILKEIQVKYEAKQGLSDEAKQGLSDEPKKELTFDQAAKSLSFIFAGSISRKGIKPKPFVDRVITSERVKQLTDKLSSIMVMEVKAELNFSNEFKNINVSI